MQKTLNYYAHTVAGVLFLEKKQSGGPSLLKVIIKNFGGSIAKGWACKLIYDGLQFVNPLVLK